MDEELPRLEFITESERATPMRTGELTGWETVRFELGDEREED
jgi:hypothetical protein